MPHPEPLGPPDRTPVRVDGGRCRPRLERIFGPDKLVSVAGRVVSSSDPEEGLSAQDVETICAAARKAEAEAAAGR
jgi:hypothetical protein